MTEIKLTLTDPERTVRALRLADAADKSEALAIADQIEAQLPRVPVEEPTEWGSVVRATNSDRLYVLADKTDQNTPWCGVDGFWHRFSDLGAVEVLRVGIGEPAPSADGVVLSTLKLAEIRMFGTVDGDLLSDESELPVGELRRLLWTEDADDITPWEIDSGLPAPSPAEAVEADKAGKVDPWHAPLAGNIEVRNPLKRDADRAWAVASRHCAADASHGIHEYVHEDGYTYRCLGSDPGAWIDCTSFRAAAERLNEQISAAGGIPAPLPPSPVQVEAEPHPQFTRFLGEVLSNPEAKAAFDAAQAEPIDDSERGMYAKFRVERTDPDAQERHKDCRVFVLDPRHDSHARPALAAYSASCAEGFPLLAADLNRWLNNIVGIDSDQPPKWVDLFGIDPNYTEDEGEAAKVKPVCICHMIVDTYPDPDCPVCGNPAPAEDDPIEALTAEVQLWLAECGSCDAGLPMGCTHPDGDPRKILLKVWRAYEAARVLGVGGQQPGVPVEKVRGVADWLRALQEKSNDRTQWCYKTAADSVAALLPEEPTS